MGEVKINTKNDMHTRFLRELRVPAELCVRGRHGRRNSLCGNVDSMHMKVTWAKKLMLQSMWHKGAEQLLCLTGPKIMSLSSWGPHITW